MVGDLAAEPLHALGTSVGGPQRITRAPSLVRPQMFDRATREWLMSPTQADGQALDPPLGPADRHQVEQALRRVLVRTVAGVDDRAA